MAALLATQPKHMRALWGNVNGERLWYALHGYEVHAPPSSRGMYGHGRVLPPDARAPAQARTASRLLLVKAARRMRRDGWNAGRLTLWLSLYGKEWGSDVRLPAVHDDQAVLAALEALWKSGPRSAAAIVPRRAGRRHPVGHHPGQRTPARHPAQRRRAAAQVGKHDGRDRRAQSQDTAARWSASARGHRRASLPAARSATRASRARRISGELENGFEAVGPGSVAPVEITCRICGQTRTETAGALRLRPELEQAYLDEVERALRCAGRFCRGPVRIALIHDGKTKDLSAGWLKPKLDPLYA